MRMCRGRLLNWSPLYSRMVEISRGQADEFLLKVEQRLVALKPELAARFSSVATALHSLEPVATESWVKLCDQMASSGWHTWESSLAYIDISEELLQESGRDLLLACGDHGLKLCQVSHEPATAYMNGIGTLMALDLVEFREKWQQTGDVITVMNHSSSLLAEYFRLGGVIAGVYPAEEFIAWIDLTAQFARQQPPCLNSFLSVCKQQKGAVELPWFYAKTLQAVANQICIDYLTLYSRLSRIVGDRLLLQLQNLLLKMAADEKECTDFLQCAAEVLNREERTRERILASCILLAEIHPRLVNRFLSSLDRLPLHFPQQLDPWIDAGSAVAKENLQAGEAYFDLQSATSQDLLHKLVGQVNFTDCQQLFHLYSEGISGRRFKIEELKDSQGSYRELPTSDGDHIYLPIFINEFDKVRENFLLYKLALLHQLGFYECGTFDFWFADSSDPYTTYFSQFEQGALATALFQILEDGRIDWYLIRRYKGIAVDLGWLMQHVLAQRPALSDLQKQGGREISVLLEAMLQHTLGRSEFQLMQLQPVLDRLLGYVAPLMIAGASINDTMQAVQLCYQVLQAYAGPDQEVKSPPDVPLQSVSDPSELPQWVPQPVYYRGKMDPDQIMLRLQLATVEEVLDDLMDGEQMTALSDLIDQSKVKIEKLSKGKVRDAMGMFLTDLEKQLAEGAVEEELEESMSDFKGMMQLADAAKSQTAPQVFFYDEWDYLIGDYRRKWCKLHEVTLDSADQTFVEETVREHQGILSQIRRQLQMLKPELQRKVKGLLDGEEIDLDRAVESIVDLQSGHSASDKVYVQRFKKERDVAALFLLDMSASTDDRIVGPATVATGDSDAKPTEASESDDFPETFYGLDSAVQDVPGRRIIDVEKESVVLMAEALEELGDDYAVCGFSGYGRNQVDYYLCKDFGEKYNYDVKGRISAIKPCRSTRMGPAIRHATSQLAKTDARIKALIIISDGYPQDFDYGKDRNLREYGIQDTTKALSEARQKGIQAFCLTVDPSGHDYLREMCPDQQYMVIQDINQLPNELSKVYRGLTS